MNTINDAALDQLFRTARTQNGWQAKPVPEAKLREMYDLLKWAPTSANSSPMRVVFVTTAAGKERLKPHLSPGNLDKTMAAPVCAIIAHDSQFQEHLPRLFPHAPNFRALFDGDEKKVARDTAAFRNGTLQGAYLMLAARAVGLDVGGMSGFNNAGVDAEFFPDGRFKSNFLCNLGYGDPTKVLGRSPRFAFEEVCSIA